MILAALLAAGGFVAWLAAAAPTPQQIRAWTAEILSSGGYQVNPPLWWRVEKWLYDAIASILRLLGRVKWPWGLGPLGEVSPTLAWVVVGVCIVLLALIIAHLALTLRGLMVERRRGVRRRTVVSRARGPQQALREAEQAAAAGQFALALRRLYEAALLILDRRGLLRYDAARTNWENLRAVAANSAEAAGLMSPLTGTVDGCVYGGAPATEDDWKRSRALVRQLWEGGASAHD